MEIIEKPHKESVKVAHEDEDVHEKTCSETDGVLGLF